MTQKTKRGSAAKSFALVSLLLCFSAVSNYTVLAHDAAISDLDKAGSEHSHENDHEHAHDHDHAHDHSHDHEHNHDNIEIGHNHDGCCNIHKKLVRWVISVTHADVAFDIVDAYMRPLPFLA